MGKNHEDRENTSNKKVLISHGAGGQMQGELIKFITNGAKVRQIENGIGLDAFDDGATIPLNQRGVQLVITSDGHTISPLFFPGGDLGKLAAAGTLNDLLMMGAVPRAISSTVFIEEGMSFKTLERIFKSFNDTLAEFGVALLCGDTKVLPKGNLDGMIMSTTGVGFRPNECVIRDANLQIGDDIIITGTIGDHGASLIAARKEINLETKLQSDVAVLKPLFEAVGSLKGIHALKDPTRGGLAAALNDWATKSNTGITIDEENLPIRKEVKAISDILGLDPLEISNEGKCIMAVDPRHSEEIITRMKGHKLGMDAAIIGKVVSTNAKRVVMKTSFGGKKFIQMPIGEPIPRVC